jgi:hypothetical protein
MRCASESSASFVAAWIARPSAIMLSAPYGMKSTFFSTQS